MKTNNLTLLLFILIVSSSCAPTGANLSLSNSGTASQETINHNSHPFQQVYDTCHIFGFNSVPNQFWFKTDDLRNLNINPDSVLAIDLRNGLEDSNYPRDKYTRSIKLRIDDVHKCENLGFLVFDGQGSNWPKNLDFTLFPELRYIKNFVTPITEKQLHDMLNTAKKLKGIEILYGGAIPECICELKDLRYIIMNNYGKLTFPECIKDLPNLKYVSIGGVSKEINDLVWNIPSLELLVLNGGRHIEIKPSIKNMTRLKQISISEIDTISFPKEFYYLDSLELFTLRWVNKKVLFQETFENLENLRGIELAQLSLNQLPLTQNHEKVLFLNYYRIFSRDDSHPLHFQNLPSLVYLVANGGAIGKEIPKDIEKLPKLQRLDYAFWHRGDSAVDFKLKHLFKEGFDKTTQATSNTMAYYKNFFYLGIPSKYSPKMY